MNLLTEKQAAVLSLVWKLGGYAFGGTARDLLRGEVPNDLDILLPHNSSELKKLFNWDVQKRKANQGSDYYNYRLTFKELSVDLITSFCSVTDCDINLILYGENNLNLLYTPKYLKNDPGRLSTVLKHIQEKQFMPLHECEPHRRYRWKVFEGRGWSNLCPDCYNWK